MPRERPIGLCGCGCGKRGPLTKSGRTASCAARAARAASNTAGYYLVGWRAGGDRLVLGWAPSERAARLMLGLFGQCQGYARITIEEVARA